MNNEIVNSKILSEYGEDLSLDLALGFDSNNLWVEVNEEIEKIYNSDFEILEDVIGQLYFNFLEV